MEQKTWWKAITYPERIDYLAFQNNELAFVLAIEKLLALEIAAEGDLDAHAPLRAEPDPLAPRLARRRPRSSSGRSRCSGTASASATRSSTSSSWSPASACTRATSRPAASPRTSRPASTPSAGSSSSGCRRRVDEYETLVDQNKIWLERTKGIGLLSADDAIALGQSGPGAARLGRQLGPAQGRSRTSPTTSVDFDVPVYDERRRLGSLQGAHGRDAPVGADHRPVPRRGCPRAPWIADDRKVVLPPREELHTSMESLIHHFKIVTEGYRVPEGEVYVDDRVAARRARLLRRLRRRPEAVARQVPRALVRRARGDRDLHARRARRRPDRDRRLARHRHGRGRPVSTSAERSLYDEIQEVRRALPEVALGRHAGAAARAGALRLAVAGGVPRGRARRSASRRRTACRSRPSTTCTTWSRSGGTSVEVCTNISCALVGAQQVLEAFESELGIHAGETTEDGEFTLRPSSARAAAAGARSSRSTTATASP